MTIRQIDMDELKEVLAEYTRSAYTVNSNLLGELKKTTEVHSAKIAEMEASIQQFHERMDSFISRAEPAIDFFQNMTWLKRGLMGSVIFVGTVLGVIAGIIKLLKK